MSSQLGMCRTKRAELVGGSAVAFDFYRQTVMPEWRGRLCKLTRQHRVSVFKYQLPSETEERVIKTDP